MPKPGSKGRLERLIATRDQLAAALAAGPSDRDLSALSREYRQLLDAIATLDDVKEKPDAVDQLAKRRSAKGSGRTRRTS